jgi:hypothetical protein
MWRNYFTAISVAIAMFLNVYGALAAGQYDVGVIPEVAGVCPTGSEYITIYMDDEDHNNGSFMSGWTGATSQVITDHVNGTRFGFCRVDGSHFFNLGHSLLINWQGHPVDSQKARVGAYSYSLLSLGSACPNDSKPFKRRIENERSNNNNSSTGDINPSYQPSNFTHLWFCLFTPSSFGYGFTMNNFPDIGIGYGVFGGYISPPSTSNGHRNYWEQKGIVYTDDADMSYSTANQNLTTYFPGYTNDDVSAVIAGISLGQNTTFYIAQVRYRTMTCNASIGWWDGNVIGNVVSYFDGAHCFVNAIPSGSTGFVYNNGYYITPFKTSICPLGYFDGNCFLMPSPVGGFISNNGFYSPLPTSGGCPGNVPVVGTNCYHGNAPWGTHPFIYANNFYTSPLYTCSNGTYDSENCYFGHAPLGTTAFIYGNAFYYSE